VHSGAQANSRGYDAKKTAPVVPASGQARGRNACLCRDVDSLPAANTGPFPFTPTPLVCCPKRLGQVAGAAYANRSDLICPDLPKVL
jgi:hypothetical protein